MPLLELDYRQRRDMRVQLATFRQSPVARQDRLTGHGIDPRRDSQPMHVLHSSTSSGKHSFLAGLRYHLTDLVHSRIHQETVRLKIWLEAVVPAAHHVEAGDQLLIDPRPLP